MGVGCGDDDDAHARAEQARVRRTESSGIWICGGVYVANDRAVLGVSARLIRPPRRATLLAARDGRDLVLHRIRAGESGEPPSEGLPHLVVGLALMGFSYDISIATKMRRHVIETRGCKGLRFYLW